MRHRKGEKLGKWEKEGARRNDRKMKRKIEKYIERGMERKEKPELRKKTTISSAVDQEKIIRK